MTQVSKWQVLARLPDYRDQWEVVKKRQYVNDIIREILGAQKMFAGYYDKFSDLFRYDSVRETCEELYSFCEQYITYKEESVKVQSSAIPTGILLRGQGDCKHYALFIGGVLGSLNRMYGEGIKWWYCFAAYNGDPEVYHVFVAVRDPETGQEMWVDPTPGSGSKTPTLLKTKKAN